jgi:release factor glutamine methyltransferase
VENATNSKVLFNTAVRQLKPLYGPDEAEAIAFLIVEKTTGHSRSQILAAVPATLRMIEAFERALNRVARHEPVQYVLGEAHFCGLSFYVNPSVLIPRPETELIVEQALLHAKPLAQPKIFDACTGSGCIAIALQHHLPMADVTGADISEDALQVARFNGQRLQAGVQWKRMNILTDRPGGFFDLLVSNPPYIPVNEKIKMPENVTKYEPGLALFVPEQDPLVFYRALAGISVENLSPGGALITEVHERLGREVANLYEQSGLVNVNILKDFAGKDRVVMGARNS